MLPKTNDGDKRIKKYLLENPITPEVKPIPDKDKKETPKNDDYNQYEVSDDKELDDKEW